MAWKAFGQFFVPVFGELDLVFVLTSSGIRINYVKFLVEQPDLLGGQWYFSSMPNMMFNPYVNSWAKNPKTGWLDPTPGAPAPSTSAVATVKGVYPWSLPSTYAPIDPTKPGGAYVPVIGSNYTYSEQYHIATSVAPGGIPDALTFITGGLGTGQGPAITFGKWGAAFATSSLVLPHSIFGYASRPKAIRLRDDGWLKGKPQAQDPSKLDYYVKDVTIQYNPAQSKFAFPNPINQLGALPPGTAKLPQYELLHPGESEYLALRMGFPVPLEEMPTTKGGWNYAIRLRYTASVFVLEGLF